jgi:hypothetical protein
VNYYLELSFIKTDSNPPKLNIIIAATLFAILVSSLLIFDLKNPKSGDQI